MEYSIIIWYVRHDTTHAINPAVYNHFLLPMKRRKNVPKSLSLLIKNKTLYLNHILNIWFLLTFRTSRSNECSHITITRIWIPLFHARPVIITHVLRAHFAKSWVMELKSQTTILHKTKMSSHIYVKLLYRPMFPDPCFGKWLF